MGHVQRLNFNRTQHRDSECPNLSCISFVMLHHRMITAASSLAQQTQGFERLPTLPALAGLTFSNNMKISKPTSGAVRQPANTATERRRRHGAFSGTEVLEDVIPASAEVNSKNLYGEPITAA